MHVFSFCFSFFWLYIIFFENNTSVGTWECICIYTLVIIIFVEFFLLETKSKRRKFLGSGLPVEWTRSKIYSRFQLFSSVISYSGKIVQSKIEWEQYEIVTRAEINLLDGMLMYGRVYWWRSATTWKLSWLWIRFGYGKQHMQPF